MNTTLSQFIKQRPHLIWYTKNYDGLKAESIVEATLNYGDWDDVQEMIKILGMEKTSAIFRRKSTPDKFGRQNYDSQVKNYFQLYFKKYAPNT